MRRAIASFVMLAFVVAAAAPALASCRMRAAQKECCCSPAPANTLCAPDCCDTVKTPRALGDVFTNLRAVILLGLHITASFSRVELTARFAPRPPPTLLVALHERAGPPLALRI